MDHRYWWIALFSVILSLLSSFWLITQHLKHFNKPYLQKYIIRILWMVPIYSMNAWFAMVSKWQIAIYLDVCREAYEAFVIYSFMKLLLNYLHYDLNLQQTIDYKPGVSHLFPLCCLGKTPGGRLLMHRCKHGILQYVIVRPVTTLLAVFSQFFDAYGEGEFNINKSYVYVLLINNISQITAMYCLALFYTGYKSELAAIKPLPKFFCIKMVIFFSFFQAVVISFIMASKYSDATTRLAQGREHQDFLICIEMLLASIAHHYAYPYQPYTDTPLNDAKRPCCFAFLRTLDFSDERNDVTDHLYQSWLRFKKSFSRKKPPSVLQNYDDMCEYTELDNLNSSAKSSYLALQSAI